MSKIIIKEDVVPRVEELIDLYNDVGWSSYTNDSIRLKNAIENSLKVFTVWDQDKLVGLIRVIGDNHTIIYIQDILVLKEYQGQGIGSSLLRLILEKYTSIRQIILMTDNTEKTINFYTKSGMVKSSDYNCIAFMK
ncbi:MAG: GNAT family N-acetyltransferase [Tissierellaceae bacterium]|nr:GNAT family N-acetyltransferase [Tissierellaceae bacterium]